MSGFDAAAVFLLALGFENLFEPVTATPGVEPAFRCKGCRRLVSRPERERHWREHRATLGTRSRILVEQLAIEEAA